MAERNEDGTFKSRDDRDDDQQQRVEPAEVSDGSERDAFEDSIGREGLSEEEGRSQIEELLTAADSGDGEAPEGMDEEALQAARERLEEDGSKEAAQDALEQMLRGEEAAESADGEAPESVALDALADELGLDPESVTTTIKVDGEEQEVSLEDLRDGHMRHRDYTRKTQELAEERREAEEQVTQAAERYASGLEQLAFVQQKLGNVLTPEQAQALSAEYEAVRQQLTEQALPSEEDLQQERGKLRESFGWDDPETWDEAKENLARYATEDLGFSEEALANARDHRLLVLLEESRRYRNLQGEASELSDKARKGSTAPKMKPGTTDFGKKSRDQGSDALSRLQRTGKTEDAAAAILESGLLGDGS